MINFVLGLLAFLVVAYLFVKLRGGQETPPAAPPRPTPALKREHWIVGLEGSAAEKAYFVGQRTVTIGRDPGNFIQIQAEKASRHHCRISTTAGVISVEDMSSRNGTTVNGESIDSHPLVDGDVIAIGEDTFRYQVEGDFEHDAGLARKDLALEQYQMTVESGDDLNVRIDAAMKSAAGNINVASETLGLAPEVLKKILDSRQDGPKKW